MGHYLVSRSIELNCRNRYFSIIFLSLFCFEHSVGLLTGVLSAFFNLDQLVHMMSIGTLMAYSIVAACVMLLRYEVANEDENVPNAKPIINNTSLWNCLWNTDKIRVPTQLTSNIVTIEVTIFCKFVFTNRVFFYFFFIFLFVYLLFIRISLIISISISFRSSFAHAV